MYKYSILMYNFNNYEIMHIPNEIDPECEYVYVTDDKNLKSDVFKIIIDDDLTGLSAFDKCYSVRFNLFKYCTTDICIYLDASMQIFKSLNKLYKAFVESNCDIGLNIHPESFNIINEYYRWYTIRNYDINEIKKCIKYINDDGYDFNYKGLYQGCLRICKNTELNKKIDNMVYETAKKLGTNGKIQRVNQTLYSFILNKYFNYIKVFPISESVIQSSYIDKRDHNKNYSIGKRKLFKEYFLFNKLIDNIYNIE